MNCSESTRTLLEGDGTGSPALAEHLAGCPACRQLAGTIQALEQLGRQERQHDLSPAAISEVRLRAAGLIAEQRTRPDRIQVLPALTLRFLSRPVMAALAAASILIAVVVFAWRQAAQDRAAGAESLSTLEIAALEADIGQLSGNLDSSLKSFRERYREKEGSSVEAMGASLKADIVSCAMDIRRELKDTGKGHQGNRGPDDRT